MGLAVDLVAIHRIVWQLGLKAVAPPRGRPALLASVSPLAMSARLWRGRA